MASKRRASRGAWFREQDDTELKRRADLDKLLLPHERAALASWHWEIWGRDEQHPPEGEWRVWLIHAGRGFGKTRAGAEWVRNLARHDPEVRIALVGASLHEVRNVMVEGESGILAAAPGSLVPDYEPSLRRLQWPNGAQAFLYSAGEPESLRGPQHSHAWCDEIAKWDNTAARAIATWDNLQLGLRLGEHPRVLATSTPRSVGLVTRLIDEARSGAVVIAHGRTRDNAGALPTAYYGAMLDQYNGSTLGRQELDGELLDEVEGALWTRGLLDRCRANLPAEAPSRIVIGVDPPASAHGAECGIVVCGVTPGGIGVVLADCSLARARPERWARAVAGAAEAWGADRVIAEANQGGAMVESVLRAAAANLPVKPVHASRGKVARAEPVAALYEAGRVRHAGMFPELEDQLCGLMAGGGYEGPRTGRSRSPDRADALVWALSELMLGRAREPRVWRL
jgi:phage terminase large subunit-like protein